MDGIIKQNYHIMDNIKQTTELYINLTQQRLNQEQEHLNNIRVLLQEINRLTEPKDDETRD